MTGTLAVAVVLVAAAHLTSVPGPPSNGLPGSTRTQIAAAADSGYVDLVGDRSQRQRAEEADPATQAATGRRWRSVNAIGCTRGLQPAAPDVDGLCDDGLPSVYVMQCDLADWQLPRWRSYLDPGASEWSPWEQVDYGTCPADRVPAMTAEDFRRLPLPAPTLVKQPEGDWVLVNIETIVRTDPAPVVLTTDLLGYQVEVEARPGVFTYDFGDGSEPLVTRDAGSAWPDFTTHHVYEQPGQASITLTTTWTGRYRLVGTEDWLDVAGTARTTTTGPAFRIEERTSRLVADLCTDRPTPPDC